MAISIFASIFPFLLYKEKRKDKIIFCLVAIIGTIAMCTSYQAASGIIPIVALFLALGYWEKRESKEAIILLALTAIAYLVGLLIFKLFIMAPKSTYVSTSLLPLKDIIPVGLGNLKKYYSYFMSDFRLLWKILIVIIIISFVIKSICKSKQNKILSGIAAILVLAVATILAFGLYPILEAPLFQARAMYGIGVLIALIGVNATAEYRVNIAKIASISLAWCFITFSCTYGNALSEQKEYIEFRMESVITALSELDVMKTDTVKNIRISGNAGKAPAVENMINHGTYGTILERLVQQSFGGEWSWDYKSLQYYKIKNYVVTTSDIYNLDELEVVKDTMYFSISTNQTDYILITLK